MEYRVEHDSMGEVRVPADKYWGAQAQRSLGNFKIGWEKQPVAIVRALGVIKQAAAAVNMATGNLDAKLGDLNRIKRCVKVLGFVNCTDDFAQQPQVINGGSNLLLELFGEEKGLPARTAMGTNSCPGNIAVEIEMLV